MNYGIQLLISSTILAACQHAVPVKAASADKLGEASSMTQSAPVNREKIDTGLKALLGDDDLLSRLRNPASRAAAQAASPVAVEVGERGDLILPLFIRTSSFGVVEAAVRNGGGTSSRSSAGILGARVPLALVSELSNLPEVEFIEGSRVRQPSPVKTSVTASVERLDMSLRLFLADTARLERIQNPSTSSAAIAESPVTVERLSDGTVVIPVFITSKNPAETESAVVESGGSVSVRSNRIVNARVPLSALREFSRRPEIEWIEGSQTRRAVAPGARFSHADPVEVPNAPPRLRSEAKGAAPSKEHRWTAGYWDWSGTAWVWVRGSWQKPPETGSRWVKAEYSRSKRGTGWLYSAPRWHSPK